MRETLSSYYYYYCYFTLQVEGTAALHSIILVFCMGLEKKKKKKKKREKTFRLFVRIHTQSWLQLTGDMKV